MAKKIVKIVLSLIMVVGLIVAISNFASFDTEAVE
jgi:hypothetical protein